MKRVLHWIAPALMVITPVTDLRADCPVSARYALQVHVVEDDISQWGSIGTGLYCCTDGIDGTPCDQSWGNDEPCPAGQMEIGRDLFNCDGSYIGYGGSTHPQRICMCQHDDEVGIEAYSTSMLAKKPAGILLFTQCTDPSCPQDPEPELCDGKEDPVDLLVDEGCGDDEHQCTSAHGEDGFPVMLASGRVESRAVPLYSLPTPAGIDFGVTIKFASHVSMVPATKRVINDVADTEPTIHVFNEAIHYYGNGWRDSFSDRLLLAVSGLSTAITWTSIRGIVTFKDTGGGWKSTSGRYELIDRGSNPGDGFGRWVIRTTDPHAPRQIWTFEGRTYTTIDGGSFESIGRLKRRALTANASNLVGYYGFTIDWAANGTISVVTDSLGRELSFDYTPLPLGCTTDCSFRVVSGVRYRPPGGSAFDVATVVHAPGCM